MARKLRRYRFSGVDQLTRQQVQLHNALSAFLPESPFAGDFKEKLRAALQPHLHVDVDLWVDEIVSVEPGTLLRLIGQPFCVAVVGLAPKSERILVQVDLPIAQQAIDRLLGGANEDVDDQRQLSEIEEGVFAFILLKALRLFQKEGSEELEVGFRLEGVVGDADALRARTDIDQRAVAITFKLFFDVAVGVCRIIIPASLIERDFAPLIESKGPASSRRLKAMHRRAGRVSLIKTEIAVELGRIGLSLEDLDGLERGDIVLIEGTEVRVDDGALTGAVQAHIGRGHHGVMKGSLAVGENGRYEVALDEIISIAPPPSDGRLGDAAYEEEEDAMARSDSQSMTKWNDAADRALRRRLRGAATVLPTSADRALDDDIDDAHSDDYEEESEGDDGDDDEPMAEAAGLLGDVAVAMVVELGRVDVSAADVLGLRPGQVIELGRSPGDPVDLVVDGKRVGKGEVVEIEGELGVRILSLGR